jgi:hypothetical protein
MAPAGTDAGSLELKAHAGANADGLELKGIGFTGCGKLDSKAIRESFVTRARLQPGR